MQNKRLLIKNLLSHNDENTFYDKKVSVDLVSNSGKSKFLKHICALSNSNPQNNSYLVIGIENETNKIVGINFIDDSIIQNLVSAYLNNPPIIKYENIYFPNLQKNLVVGLLTIRPTKKRTCFKKNIGKIPSGVCYYRKGSNSLPIDNNFSIDSNNKKTVTEIEKISTVSIKMILDDVFNFYKLWSEGNNPQYVVYNEQYVVCWAGYRDNYDEKPILSEVDIRIINEGVQIFYSAIQWVDVLITESDFSIIEYVNLGFDNNYKLYPYEKTIITFENNGKYRINKEFIFTPPNFEKDIIENLYVRAKKMEKKLRRGDKIVSYEEHAFAEGIAVSFLLCYFNGIEEAKKDLINSRNYLDGSASLWQKECIRILDRIENNTINGS